MSTLSFDPKDYFDLEHTAHRMLFENTTNVWGALEKIATYLQFSLRPGFAGELVGKPFIGPNVFYRRGHDH